RSALRSSVGPMTDEAEALEVYETPWRRDAAEVGPRLSAWAAARFGPDVAVADLREPGNGLSSETLLFDLVYPDGERVRAAARLASLPSVFPVFAEYDLDLQRRCMEVVGAATEVPVPGILCHETDDSWLDTPFLVMKRVDGAAPPDLPPYVFGGWVIEARAEL